MIGINKKYKKNTSAHQKVFTLGKDKGFAMLYTIILITIISTLAFGSASLSYKQRQLARLVLDSQNALYLADSGLECALHYYYQEFNANSYVLPPMIECLSPYLDISGNPELLILDSLGTTLYEFPPTYPLQNSCFEIEVDIDTSVTPNITTAIRSKGYNVCDPTNSNRVERTLEVTFE